MLISKKNYIKIPKNTKIIYCKKKKIISIIGSQFTKSVKIEIDLLINENEIKVSQVPLNRISNNKKKKIKAIQGTTTAILKQLITESSTIMFKKLKIIGVGYRILTSKENLNKKLLTLKLGYSHHIYFKISSKLNFFCLKLTRLFLYGNSIQELFKEASMVRSLKKPEPYKGKGILYELEKITLKAGKRT